MRFCTALTNCDLISDGQIVNRIPFSINYVKSQRVNISIFKANIKPCIESHTESQIEDQIPTTTN